MENAGMDTFCRELIMARLINSQRDLRYNVKAYEFIYTIFSILDKTYARQEEEFSAKQIVDTTVCTATASYGPIAEFVLADMGIKTANDISAIISNFVDLDIFDEAEVSIEKDFDELSQKSLFGKVKNKPLNMEKLKFFEDS